jgi:hypothetical protein
VALIRTERAARWSDTTDKGGCGTVRYLGYTLCCGLGERAERSDVLMSLREMRQD